MHQLRGHVYAEPVQPGSIEITPGVAAAAEMLSYVGGIYRCLSLVSFTSRLLPRPAFQFQSFYRSLAQFSPRFYYTVLSLSLSLTSVLVPAPVVVAHRRSKVSGHFLTRQYCLDNEIIKLVNFMKLYEMHCMN